MDETNKNNADIVRLRLQYETNLLVWVRTSLGLMGFGFVIARFGLFLRELAEAGHQPIRYHPNLAFANSITGTAMIGLGVLTLLTALATHHVSVMRLERGEVQMPHRWSLGMILSVILAAFGMLLATYLTYVQLDL